MKVDKNTAEDLVYMVNAEIVDGKEVFDPKPMFVEGLKRPLSIKDRVDMLFRARLSQQAEAQGHETWEEFNDFDIEDEEPMPISGFEVHLMQEEFPSSLNNGAEGPEPTQEANPPKADRSDEGAQPTE